MLSIDPATRGIDIVFSQLKASLKQRARAAMRDRRGAVLIYTALAAPVFIGTVGLSVDVAGWQAQKRQLQTIADAAALGGALERLRSGLVDGHCRRGIRRGQP